MSYLSKSIISAMGCEFHYAGTYLADNSRSVALYNEARQTGTDFHTGMARYINHLVEEDKPSDPQWMADFTTNHPLTPDAIELLRRVNLTIVPGETLGTEVFLTIDEHGEPVEKDTALDGHRSPRDPRSRFGGSLDWVRLTPDDQGHIVDWKTAYTTLGASEAEAALYALLLFRRYPYLKRVNFSWWFARLERAKSLSYDRSEVDGWIWPMVNSAARRREDIERRYRAGEPLTINPFSGRCHYCDLKCPAYETTNAIVQIENGKVGLAIPPIQSKQAAVALAQARYVAALFQSRVDQMLKQYIDANGPFDVGMGLQAEVATQVVRKRPLIETLQAMGITLADSPDEAPCPNHDIPLERLYVSGMSGYLKAQKRARTREVLDKIARESTRSILRITSGNPTDVPLSISGTDEDE